MFFSFLLVEKWRELYKPITERSKARPKQTRITFKTKLKSGGVSDEEVRMGPNFYAQNKSNSPVRSVCRWTSAKVRHKIENLDVRSFFINPKKSSQNLSTQNKSTRKFLTQKTPSSPISNPKKSFSPPHH